MPFLLFYHTHILFLDALCHYLDAEKLGSRKGISLSPVEESWLGHISSFQPRPSSYSSLLAASERVFGVKKISSISPKHCPESVEGESTLKNKIESFLQKSIENCHNAISVISTNMGKLAGKVQ